MSDDNEHKCTCGGTCGRGVGRPAGSKRATEPRAIVHSQRYTEAESKMIESVAANQVNDFIRDAALDRARVMVEQWGPM